MANILYDAGGINMISSQVLDIMAWLQGWKKARVPIQYKDVILPV